ncbi:MAG: SdrD B-like domain-containing protein, partial [Casimicrobium sp.]
IGFPITRSVFADFSLGDVASDVTDAFARTYRLSLGANGVRGAAAQVFSEQFDLRVGAGQRGDLTGSPYPGWQRSQGLLAWAGYTQRFAQRYFAGVQIANAQRIQAASTTTQSLIDVQSVAASVGRTYSHAQSGDFKVRGTVIGSRRDAELSPDSRSATGVYFEAGYLHSGYRHEVGAYWSEPDLYYGDSLLASDSRGAYWRVDRSGTRLQWGAGIDYEQRNISAVASAVTTDVVSAGANATYRLDRNSLVGGNITFSDSKNKTNNPLLVQNEGNRSYSASAYYQTQMDWGRSRLSANLRHNQTIATNALAATGETLEWEHDWVTAKYETQKPEFVTTLGVARDRSGEEREEVSPTAAVQFRYWLDADWSVGGNLRYASRTSNLSVSRGLSGMLSSERVFGGGWRVGLSASINEANVRVKNDGTFGGVLDGGSLVTRSNDKSVFLYVRYDGTRGTPYQALGLRNAGAAGTGDIRGIVYFDGNRDGEQQADERGVPGVEVTLDGRYRTITNAEGRFEFPVVATGSHRLTLKLETVPLPWGAALESGSSIDVPLRGSAQARIPVVRVGE